MSNLSENWRALQQLAEEKSKQRETPKSERELSKSERTKRQKRKFRRRAVFDEKTGKLLYFKSAKNAKLVECSEKNDGKKKCENAEAKSTAACASRQDLSKLTKAVALDCEFVGVGVGGRKHMLARVSLVNEKAELLYDTFVRPYEDVVDYRTRYSGIRAGQLDDGLEFERVREEVREIISGRLLVGHELRSDLKVLQLKHPVSKRRDTARLVKIRNLCGISEAKKPSLRLVAEKLLGVKIQTEEHSSIQDATYAMRIFAMLKKGWAKVK